MAKKKKDEPAEGQAAEAAPAEAPAETAPAEAADNGQPAAGEKISKMEAVRRILTDDPDMKPQEGIEAVKARFGLDLSTGNFSAYKSQIRAKDGTGKKRKTTAAPAAREPAPAKATGAMAAVKDFSALVDRHGAETVKALASLLGK